MASDNSSTKRCQGSSTVTHWHCSTAGAAAAAAATTCTKHKRRREQQWRAIGACGCKHTTQRTLTTLLRRCTSALLLLPAKSALWRAATRRGAARLLAWREAAALLVRAAQTGCATARHDMVWLDSPATPSSWPGVQVLKCGC